MTTRDLEKLVKKLEIKLNTSQQIIDSNNKKLQSLKDFNNTVQF